MHNACVVNIERIGSMNYDWLPMYRLVASKDYTRIYLWACLKYTAIRFQNTNSHFILLIPAHPSCFLTKDAENHGEGKSINAFVALLEKNEANETLLKYHASTPNETSKLLGKPLNYNLNIWGWIRLLCFRNMVVFDCFTFSVFMQNKRLEAVETGQVVQVAKGQNYVSSLFDSQHNYSIEITNK